MSSKTISKNLKKKIEGLATSDLDKSICNELKEWSRRLKGDILKMTSLAASGHPGGSMSSLDIFLMTYCAANINPNSPHDPTGGMSSCNLNFPTLA